MRRRAVKVEVILLDVFAMIALAVGQPVQALLDDRVSAVPQRERKAQDAMIIGNAGQTVLAPAIGARARLVVGEIIPGVAILAVVLTYRSPLALAQVGAPLFPRHRGLAAFPQPPVLRAGGRSGVRGTLICLLCFTFSTSNALFHGHPLRLFALSYKPRTLSDQSRTRYGSRLAGASPRTFYIHPQRWKGFKSPTAVADTHGR